MTNDALKEERDEYLAVLQAIAATTDRSPTTMACMVIMAREVINKFRKADRQGEDEERRQT